MQEIFGQIVTQWGLVGVLGIAAGWIIYDSFKKNKDMEQYYREKIDERRSYDGQSFDGVDTILSRMDRMVEKQDELRTELMGRIDDLEAKVDASHPVYVEGEADKLSSVISIAPIVHSILNNSIDDIRADHLLVCLLHNGTHTLTGTPFMKFDVVAEKFFPAKNPQDDELCMLYKDHDLMQHNKLPSVILQGEARLFDINKNELKDIDPSLNAKLMKRGVKYIAFDVFRNTNGLPNGFIVGYSFEHKINLDELEEACNTIEVTFRSM